MFVKELWRYPVKSMAGERIPQAEVGELGIAEDRWILVHIRGKLISSRTHHQLLGLKGTLGSNGVPLISGHEWDSPEALHLVKEAAGPDAELIQYNGAERFDVLPLLVATDGAINHMGFDGRRLRPNVVIGGVEGLKEREWPGHRVLLGGAIIHVAQLRGRCIMTTFLGGHLKTGHRGSLQNRPTGPQPGPEVVVPRLRSARQEFSHPKMNPAAGSEATPAAGFLSD
jgi:hypothetical protein